MAKATTTAPNKGFVDIELSGPIKVDGADVKAMRMREPTLGDQLANEELGDVGDAKKEVALFAALCMVTPDDMKQLTLRDYRKLQKAFSGFIV